MNLRLYNNMNNKLRKCWFSATPVCCPVNHELYKNNIKKVKSTCFEYCRGNIRQVGDSDILRSISIQLLLFAFALTFKALYANFSRKAKKKHQKYILAPGLNKYV